jgi:hypothetical protein
VGRRKAEGTGTGVNRQGALVRSVLLLGSHGKVEGVVE